MNAKLRFRLIVLCLSACLLLVTVPARAQFSGPIGITKGQATAIVVGIAAVGAAIGLGLYFLIRTPPAITGCASASAGGLSLQNERDQKSYVLIGDASRLKAGDRLRVKGKRKKSSSGTSTFVVEKLSKDFGPCKTAETAP